MVSLSNLFQAWCSICRLGLRRHVRLQYNAVSAWVPASFAVPKLLPGLPAWMNMKKKKQTHAEPSDGEKPAFRQVGLADAIPTAASIAD